MFQLFQKVLKTGMAVELSIDVKGMKIAYLTAVLLHVLCLQGRFVIDYQLLMDSLALLFVFYIYLPCLIIGVVCSVIQIYAIYREIKQDLIWRTLWFDRMFFLFFVLFIFHQSYWLFCALFVYIHFETGWVSILNDVIDGIACFVVNLLFILILLRPYIANGCYKNNDQTVAYSITENNTSIQVGTDPARHVAAPNNLNDGPQTCLTNWSVAFALSLVVLAIYLIGCLLVFIFMIVGPTN